MRVEFPWADCLVNTRLTERTIAWMNQKVTRSRTVLAFFSQNASTVAGLPIVDPIAYRCGGSLADMTTSVRRASISPITGIVSSTMPMSVLIWKATATL